MGASVAGQIRIDLIAEAAKFNAGLQSGGQALGNFAEQAERVDRRLGSQKSLAEFAKREQDAWVRAMRSGDGPLQNAHGFLGGLDRDIGLVNQSRWKSMVPWGNSMRMELSREAAETAALIGSKQQVIVSRLRQAMTDIGMAGLRGGGVGGVVSAGLMNAAGAVMAHPLTAIGIGAAAYTAHRAYGVESQRDEYAREARNSALMLGQGVEDTSRMNAVGFDSQMLSRFQRATADRSEGFATLKIDPEKLGSQSLRESLGDVAKAFDSVRNPSDRAKIAFELFGKSGAQVLPILDHLKEKMDRVAGVRVVTPEQSERTRAYDVDKTRAADAMDTAYSRLLRPFEGLATGYQRMKEVFSTLVAHPGELLSRLSPSTPSRLDAISSRYKEEDYRIGHADELERERIASDAMAQSAKEKEKAEKAAAAHAKSEADELFRAMTAAKGIQEASLASWRDAMYGSGTSEEDRYRNEMRYRPRQEIEEGVDRLRGRREETLLGHEAQSSLNSMKTETPELRRDRAYAAAESWKKNHAATEQNDDAYWNLRTKAMRDYYREKAGLDAESLRASLRSPLEEYQERMKYLQDFARYRDQNGSGALSDRQNAALGDRYKRDLKSQVGVADPLGDYENSVKELDEAYRSGKSGITGDQYARRKKELRKQAVNGMISGEDESPRLAPAMTAGSQDAYSVIARGMIGDPKEKAAQETVTKLNEIDQRIAETNGKLADLVNLARGGKTL